MTFETSGAHLANHGHETLSDYLNGGLSESESRQVTEHLATCLRCQADLATLRLSVGALRSLPLRPSPRSFALPVARSRTPPLITWLRVSSGALAAAFVAVLAAQLVLNNGTPPGSAPVIKQSAASRGVGPAVDRAAAVSPPRPQAANPALPGPAPLAAQPAAPATPQPAAAPPLAPQSPAVPATAPQIAAAPAAAAARPAPAVPSSTPPANQSVAKGAAGSQVQVAGPTPTFAAYPEPTTPFAPPAAPPIVSYPGAYPAPGGSRPTETPPSGGAPTGSVINLGGWGSWFTPALAILGLLTIVSIGAMLLLSHRR